MKNGFTLIELLSVIVILAIIALIAIPIVLNIINETKESASLRSAEFYLDAVEYTIANVASNNEGFDTVNYYITETGNLCEVELVSNKCPVKEIAIKIKGEKPKSGMIEVKGVKINSVKIVLNDKKIINNSKGDLIYNPCTLIKDDGEVGITPGDKYICEVKPGTKYTFYVLSNNESEGTTNLIMDQNIYSDGTPSGTTIVYKNGSNKYTRVAWYAGTELDNSYGPVTAMNFVYEATKNWINIPPINYEFYEEGTYGYKAFIAVNGILNLISRTEPEVITEIGTSKVPLRARLPKYIKGSSESEVAAKTQKPYLYDNMNGNTIKYWTLNSVVTLEGSAYLVGYNDSPWSWNTNLDYNNGVRPVITLEL